MSLRNEFFMTICQVLYRYRTGTGNYFSCLFFFKSKVSILRILKMRSDFLIIYILMKECKVQVAERTPIGNKNYLGFGNGICLPFCWEFHF